MTEIYFDTAMVHMTPALWFEHTDIICLTELVNISAQNILAFRYYNVVINLLHCTFKIQQSHLFKTIQRRRSLNCMNSMFW